jgi:mRNA interferase MazF
VLAFISSVVPANLESSDLLFDPAAQNFPITGLKVASVLRLHRLVTVSASIIKRKLGTLPANDQAEVR